TAPRSKVDCSDCCPKNRPQRSSNLRLAASVTACRFESAWYGCGQTGAGSGNSLLNAFLDSDRNGRTELGDVVKFAGRFLNPA
ncbi:MAG TPA: hypothetical protein V6D06_07565, partial [Trichocoleus sp.]